MKTCTPILAKIIASLGLLVTLAFVKPSGATSTTVGNGAYSYENSEWVLEHAVEFLQNPISFPHQFALDCFPDRQQTLRLAVANLKARPQDPTPQRDGKALMLDYGYETDVASGAKIPYIVVTKEFYDAYRTIPKTLSFSQPVIEDVARKLLHEASHLWNFNEAQAEEFARTAVFGPIGEGFSAGEVDFLSATSSTKSFRISHEIESDVLHSSQVVIQSLAETKAYSLTVQYQTTLAAPGAMKLLSEKVRLSYDSDKLTFTGLGKIHVRAPGLNQADHECRSQILFEVQNVSRAGLDLTLSAKRDFAEDNADCLMAIGFLSSGSRTYTVNKAGEFIEGATIP